jgi:hypothetical protein
MHAIAGTGLASIFIMKGTPHKNLHMVDHPITITLPGGSKVVPTHICDITISGLPTILTGHIVPGVTMAFLIGIRIICKAGCKVTFKDKRCEFVYKNTIILHGYKDQTIDLWTLPLTLKKISKTTPVEVTTSPNSAPCKPIAETASFSYTRTNKINNIKFAHQSLCNPPISSLIKTINAGFLKGAPHLDTHSVQKYLFASPATSKGHMKRLHKGIQSIRTTKPTTATQVYSFLRRPQQVEDHTMPGLNHPQHNDKADNRTIGPPPHLIHELNNNSIPIVFCFKVFMDKISGVVHNDCTGNL